MTIFEMFYVGGPLDGCTDTWDTATDGDLPTAAAVASGGRYHLQSEVQGVATYWFRYLPTP